MSVSDDLMRMLQREGSGDRGNQFYQILSGAVRMKALEAFLDLKLPELLCKEGPMESIKICEKLHIVQNRGTKFLHLLVSVGLLEENNKTLDKDTNIFGLSALAKELFGDGDDGFSFRELVALHRAVVDIPIIDVLHGMASPDDQQLHWPPATFEHAVRYEKLMTETAKGPLQTILLSGAMVGGHKLLDVGGGEGTIGCGIFEAYNEENLTNVTVFNLPNSAILARKAINRMGMIYDVQVHQGDFLRDELPTGFDRILYSRVLCDWSPDVCLMQFQKVRRALVPGGKIIINEVLLEGNADFCITWEFGHIFTDTYGRALFKPLEVYRKLLREAGFEITKISPMIDDAFYSVIEAVVVSKHQFD